MTLDTAAAIERVIAFVNTLDIDAGTDEIATPEQLHNWLQSQGLLTPGSHVEDDDLASAHRLREGLRAAMLSHDAHAEESSSGANTTIPLQLVITTDGSVHLAPADVGGAAALGELVAPLPAAVADGTWLRAKACPKSSCQWAFFDRSKNRSRRWCSMDVCGNQEKTRTFRERQRPQN
jgi:predicted RNA-binding Zn ribbon-like protein